MPLPSLHPARRLGLLLLGPLSLASCIAAYSQTPPPAPAPDRAAPVRLTGSNGREVEFAGIWEARPEGLVVLATAEDQPVTVAWEKLDLERLKTTQPALEAARQRARFLRSPQPVNLGLFAGLLTPAQAGTELRHLLDTALVLKVPVRYRITTTSTNTTTLIPPRPIIYNGLVLPPPPDAPTFVAQTNKTVSETRFSPDEFATTPRRTLEVLARTDGIAAQDRRDLFDLVKTNPELLETVAGGLERILASLPPRHLLPKDPTVITFVQRVPEFAAGLRALGTAITINYADQVLIRDLLRLVDGEALR